MMGKFQLGVRGQKQILRTPPQTELRLGPRSLRMTALVGSRLRASYFPATVAFDFVHARVGCADDCMDG